MKLSGRWLLLLVPLVLSFGTPQQTEWVGVVKVKGNAPFTFVALVDDEGHQWRLSGARVPELRARAQGLRVVLTGQPSGKDAILVSSWAWAPEETKSDR